MLYVSLASHSLVVSLVPELGLARADPGLTSTLAVLPVLWLSTVRTPGHAWSEIGTIGMQPEMPLEKSEGFFCWRLCVVPML